jgi:hypothetical protein
VPDVSDTPADFPSAARTEDWRLLQLGASAWFDTPSPAAGVELIRGIVALVEDGAPQPDIDLRPSGVHLRIPTGANGLTTADLALARAISGLARELRLPSDPTALQALQLAFDVIDKPAVMQFWRVVFNYEAAEDALIDPMRRDPSIRFSSLDRPRPLRNRIHLDVAWPDDASNSRRRTALANGGHVVTAERPWVIDDPEGNEVCLPLDPTAALDDDPGTADWRQMGSAMACYPTGSFRASVDLAATVTNLSEDAGIALMVDLRPDGVTIDSGKDQHETEDYELDPAFVRLARRTQAAARGLGLVADPSPRRRFLQISIHAVDVSSVREFWMAALGYRQGPYARLAQDTYDPRRLSPVVWFQQIDAQDITDAARRAQRNRVHLDLFVPGDHARARVDAALAAGGRITEPAEGQASWTIADPEGNEVNITVASQHPLM